MRPRRRLAGQLQGLFRRKLRLRLNHRGLPPVIDREDIARPCGCRVYLSIIHCKTLSRKDDTTRRCAEADKVGRGVHVRQRISDANAGMRKRVEAVGQRRRRRPGNGAREGITDQRRAALANQPKAAIGRGAEYKIIAAEQAERFGNVSRTAVGTSEPIRTTGPAAGRGPRGAERAACILAPMSPVDWATRGNCGGKWRRATAGAGATESTVCQRSSFARRRTTAAMLAR